MSFSYGTVPPPESPPLRATPLSPAPPRNSSAAAAADRRAKRYTTMGNTTSSSSHTLGVSNTSLSPASIANSLGSLSLDDDPLDLNAHSASTSHSASVSAYRQSSMNRRASAMPSIPVPKMINPLPEHYIYPTSASTRPTSTPSSTSTHESSSSSSSSDYHSSSSSSSSYSSSASSSASSANSSLSNKRKKSMPKLNCSTNGHANGNTNSKASGNPTGSSDSLSSSSEPLTPTSATTISRSRWEVALTHLVRSVELSIAADDEPLSHCIPIPSTSHGRVARWTWTPMAMAMARHGMAWHGGHVSTSSPIPSQPPITSLHFPHCISHISRISYLTLTATLFSFRFSQRKKHFARHGQTCGRFLIPQQASSWKLSVRFATGKSACCTRTPKMNKHEPRANDDKHERASDKAKWSIDPRLALFYSICLFAKSTTRYDARQWHDRHGTTGTTRQSFPTNPLHFSLSLHNYHYYP
ncbi:hypothetical protein FRC15_000218 [Serendipita sp. 397]|nr:hypothetical protein FRC15_000218 [Serendipita sp. 397]